VAAHRDVVDRGIDVRRKEQDEHAGGEISSKASSLEDQETLDYKLQPDHAWSTYVELCNTFQRIRKRMQVSGYGVTPAVDRTFPLEEAADAMRGLVSSQVRGKLVLRVAA
jgi:Zinc-binding dehydrogenase